MAGWVQYRNQGATRNQRLDPRLERTLGEILQPLGVTAEVFSGGQDASGPRRTGSHRHDHGGAGDVFFVKDGRRLDWANPNDLPVFETIVQRGKAQGITGFGAGQGYMQPGSMHIGYGSPGVWGAGGSGKTAADWLRKAYGGAVPSPAPAGPGAPSITSPQSVASWGGAPTPASDVTAAVPTQQVQSINPPDLYSLALSYMQNKKADEVAQAAEAEAEQTRKAALFGNLGALFG